VLIIPVSSFWFLVSRIKTEHRMLDTRF
jgi:hypothetical protein